MLEGCVRGAGAAALRFHGMVQGLVVLLTSTPTVAPAPRASVAATAVPAADAAFVRLLANIVLRTHAELMHVY